MSTARIVGQRFALLAGCAILTGVFALNRCSPHNGGTAGHVTDEAMQAKRAVASFPAADEDYFHGMDQTKAGILNLNTSEVQGRNTWIVWTGGNDRFWDEISRRSVGTLDFLKTISSHPSLKFGRGPGGKNNRWSYLGVVNEPCFTGATGPDPNRKGLWLDKRVTGPGCPPDPFENEEKYKGVKIGARGKNLPVGSSYGYATGIVGLRLFPNPDFDEAAEKKWDPEKYYTDPSYYLRKDLIKPYRVGMSCGFCHVGPNPLKPPADPENPQWENLSSNVGAQYFWVDRIFAWEADPKSFAFQLFHTSRPGSLDTSLVSSDNINNPRTMNAVYNLLPRLQVAKAWGQETLKGGGLNNKQFNDFVPNDPLLSQFFKAPDTVWTPHVLKDGSDSVGALGALNRVYLNIGLFSEEWLLHFNALTGGKPTTPIQIKDARDHSVYWQATEAQTPGMALFFLKSTAPQHLADAPDGAAEVSRASASDMATGRKVFAERCARCHSSKYPDPPADASPGNCAGPNYMNCFAKYWKWTKTDEYKTKMRAVVNAPDFLEGNYLSTDVRIPVTLLQTNACSPLATNSIAGSIWDNFSSQSYKDLPSVGTITVHNPMTGAERAFNMPAGGRGYTRPPSLISMWSTAPYLLNNSLGTFNVSPSVNARLASFNDSIEQLLWPEKRKKDSQLGDKGVFLIDRTTERSYLRVPTGYLPDAVQFFSGIGQDVAPNLFGSDGLEIGPIPAGTPVGLLSNLAILETPTSDTLDHKKKILGLLFKIKKDLKELGPNATDEQAKQVFLNLLEPLLSMSNCPDLEVNRGHYFGTSYFQEKDEPGLSDPEKRALIGYLKTF